MSHKGRHLQTLEQLGRDQLDGPILKNEGIQEEGRGGGNGKRKSKQASVRLT